MSRYTEQQLDRLVETVRTGRVPRMSQTTTCGCEATAHYGDKVVGQPEGTLHVVVDDIAYCPLHAAAPELLAAVKHAQDRVEELTRRLYASEDASRVTLAMIRTAIAHAEERG